MENKEHYKRLERMYLKAPINRIYRPDIAISEGRAEIRMAADEKFFHAAQALHGAVYFKMLDDAAFFAASSLVKDTFLLTSSFNLHFFRPITGGLIRSVGSIKFATRSYFVAEASLFLDDGKEAAAGSGTFVRSKKTLDETIGYL